MDDIEHIQINIADYQPHPRNYNEHPDPQVGEIAESLRLFGQVKPVVVWRDWYIAGHGVVLGAQRLGWTQLKAERLPADWPEYKALAYLAADNELARGASPNLQALAALAKDVQAQDAGLGRLAAGGEEGLRRLAEWMKEPVPDDPGPQIDRAEELREVWGVESGQMWQLGEHRLACGDCTDAGVVARVMGGERAQIIFTSPPYAQQRDYAGQATEKVSDWDTLMQGAFGAAICADDCQVLVNLGLVHRGGEWSPYWDGWIEWMRQQGWRRFAWYVWDQGPGLPGDWNGRLAPSFEFVFHFNRTAVRPEKWTEKLPESRVSPHGTGLRQKDGSTSGWTSPNAFLQPTKVPDNVIRVMREKARNIKGHPAMFPVALPEFILRCWNGLLYEPFLGSGTTLIACERLGRRCRAVEISPAYCGVAIQRWVDMTGRQPVLLPDA